jgi:replicative DNA helicase
MLPLSQLQSSSKGKSYKKRSYSSYDKADATENPFAGARVPPQDLESEKALIGSLLLSSDALFDIADLINPQSFYAVKHQIIYETIEELVNNKEPVDILTVSASLRAKKVFDQVGTRISSPS